MVARISISRYPSYLAAGNGSIRKKKTTQQQQCDHHATKRSSQETTTSKRGRLEKKQTSSMGSNSTLESCQDVECSAFYQFIDGMKQQQQQQQEEATTTDKKQRMSLSCRAANSVRSLVDKMEEDGRELEKQVEFLRRYRKLYRKHKQELLNPEVEIVFIKVARGEERFQDDDCCFDPIGLQSLSTMSTTQSSDQDDNDQHLGLSLSASNTQSVVDQSGKSSNNRRNNNNKKLRRESSFSFSSIIQKLEHDGRAFEERQRTIRQLLSEAGDIFANR